MNALGRLGSVVALALGALACGPSVGPKIRVATATPQQIEAAEDQDNVWYEFQPGDVIPVQFAFLGVMEGGSREAVFRAKRHFWFVMFKNAPMQVSFDGETFAGSHNSQSMIGVIPRKDGQGGQLGWFIYMGESGDARAELGKLVEEANAGAAPAAEPGAAAAPTP
jgi:hypothetical protein